MRVFEFFLIVISLLSCSNNFNEYNPDFSYKVVGNRCIYYTYISGKKEEVIIELKQKPVNPELFSLIRYDKLGRSSKRTSSEDNFLKKKFLSNKVFIEHLNSSIKDGASFVLSDIKEYEYDVSLQKDKNGRYFFVFHSYYVSQFGADDSFIIIDLVTAETFVYSTKSSSSFNGINTPHFPYDIVYQKLDYRLYNAFKLHSGFYAVYSMDDNVEDKLAEYFHYWKRYEDVVESGECNGYYVENYCCLKRGEPGYEEQQYWNNLCDFIDDKENFIKVRMGLEPFIP